MSLYGLPRCIGGHVPEPASHCETLVWHRINDKTDEARITRQTCPCSYPVFQLCVKDDEWFIRRTVSAIGRAGRIWETDRWPRNEAESIWSALLMGHVR
ncbi:hypothetical protein HNP84_000385 [Thermocatellispora tengchongensis]|uniref:Uncharacterized protein n=1 Tax=Thermocatellispora tengchongensis TaxID=1073253 RepID=A0A840P0A5_9ACTN|nr:hypothetical protein [Thermocatellispora tengchongensis]MBB5130697.1 hypothetical protein [Thermocatellispora tengchongensis]